MKKRIVAALAVAAMAMAGCKISGPAQSRNAGTGGAGTAGGGRYEENADSSQFGGRQMGQLPGMTPGSGAFHRGPQGDGTGAAAQDFPERNVNERALPRAQPAH
ncbi:MAG: hypothetical protein IRZ16_20460 [Myxococcaceae bacterium]|nr:hypothetical protein [Myxococcaceae bacterium]